MTAADSDIAESEADAQAAIHEVLSHLEAVSYVAHRDVSQTLPSVEPFGARTTLSWIEAARTLFFHDRDAGKAFIRNTTRTIAETGVVDLWVEQATAFCQWVGTYRAVEGFMGQVADVYAQWGDSGERRWYELGMSWLERHVDSAAAFFNTPYERLAGGNGPQGLETLMSMALALFDERRLPLSQYLEGALQVRDLLGAEAMSQWARRGADVLAAGRQRGESYFRLETDESVALLMESMPGFRVRDHARFLQLLGAGWFGEALPIHDSGWRPHHGRAMGETDGRNLYLPTVLPDREEAVLAVLHLTGHLRFDTYDHLAIEQLFERLGMSHPPVDEHQRITWRPLFAAYGEEMFRFQLLFDLCEDLRIDSRVDREVPGYLKRMLQRARVAHWPQGPARSYYAAGVSSLEGALGHGELDQRLVPLLGEEATLVDAFDIANELYREGGFPPISAQQRQAAYLPGRGQNAARPVYPTFHDRELSETDHAEANTGFGEGEQPQTRQTGPQDAQGDPDLDVAPENTSGSGGRIGVGIPQPAQVVGRGVQRQPDPGGIAYPEWDYRIQQYIPEWTRVKERVLEECDAARAQQLVVEHSKVLKRLRRALEMQKPNRPTPLRRQLEGDELDIDATVMYVAEKRAGQAPKPLVYQRRAVCRRDTAVLLLADLSTSIMQKAKNKEGLVVDRLRAGLLVFSEALESVGDAYAIRGFASKYRDNVYYYRIKEFAATLDAEVRAAIGGLSGRLASRMGAAIRHAISDFQKTSAPQRLLLILSDGRPADYDDGGDQHYLHEDTRRAMKEAVDAGIHPFCVTLDPRGSEYLPAIFGPGHYMVVDDIDELPARLPEIYLRLRR